jgi:hypothetical protein
MGVKNSLKSKSAGVTRESLISDLKRVDKQIKELVGKDSYITRDYYRKHGKYKESAVVAEFGSFKNAVDIIFKKDGTKVTRDHITNSYVHKNVENQVFFVSAVIAGGVGREPVYQAIKQFEKHNSAKVVMLSMRGLSEDDSYENRLLELFGNDIYADYWFNSNLRATDMKLYPQQMNPLTSLDRIGSKGTSMIIAHPKQQMIVVPTGMKMNPHMLWSTGSITLPYYRQTRSGRLALVEHVEGGLVIEVENDRIFHVRQIQFNKDGSFQDLNKVYSPSGVTFSDIEVMTLGDIHAGWVDENARKATFEQIELLRPKQVFVGDVLDCSSISHHNINNLQAKYKLPPHLKTLEKELHTYAKELSLYVKAFPWLKVNLVYGNHEDHLMKYLREARYALDIPENHYLALELSKDMLDGKNPIEEWCRRNYPELMSNIVWLKKGEDIRVDGIIMSVHGDKGHSGSKGTPSNIEKSYGKSNTGHTHSALILRDAYVAGCMCVFDMPYTEGSASKWSHSNIINYKNGKRTIVNSFSGKWTINLKKLKAESSKLKSRA